jgi:hypothetical protein
MVHRFIYRDSAPISLISTTRYPPRIFTVPKPCPLK